MPIKQQHPIYSLIESQLFRYSALAVAMTAGLMSTAAFGNPAGGAVVSGSASFSGSGHILTITNTPGTIINWESFSINKGELTQFIQQSAASQVLNRVTGGDPSQILGTLQSNGQVFIINPNGVSFGAGAQVDVAGLVVSSLNISNGNFLASNLVFDSNANAGKVQNAGSLNAATGGDIIMVAPIVENSGIITAANGDIMLVAGAKVNLTSLDHPSISVELAAPANQAVNLGQLIASNISIFGGIVDNGGQIAASTARVGQNGQIILDAQEQLITEQSSVIKANGQTGGEIVLASQDLTQIAGTVEAKAVQPVLSASPVSTVPAETGGLIAVLGPQIQVQDKASLDVSGVQGGGTLLVGNDEHGQATPLLQNIVSSLPTYNTATPNTAGKTSSAMADLLSLYTATNISISALATLRADAGQQGDGGKIIVFANNTADIYGTISATGGLNSGNGGFVETSGKKILSINTFPNLTAPNGNGGTWLIDPANVTIMANADNDNDDAGTYSFPSDNDDNVISTATIDSALNAGINISISTVGGGMPNDPPGNININDAIFKSQGSDASLSLFATYNININANITSTSGKLNLVLDAGQGGAGGTSNLASGVSVNNNGGEISFENGLNVAGAITNASIVSSDGSILTGSNGYLNGVTLGDASSLQLQTSGIFFIQNGLNLYNGLTLNMQDSSFNFQGAAFASSNSETLTAVGAANPTATIEMSNGFIGTYDSGNNEVLTIASGVTIAGSGQIGDGLSANTITNNGDILANTNQTLSINPNSFNNNGTLSVYSGEILVNPGNSASAWTNAGLIEISSAATFGLNGQDLINNGTVEGIGKLDLGSRSANGGLLAGSLINDGLLTPVTDSGTIGTLTIIGNLVNHGSIAISLAGTTPGSYGVINMTENTGFPSGQLASASLGGTLIITENNGFFADLGDRFLNLISADGVVSGTFTSYSYPVDVNFTHSVIGNFSLTDTIESITRWVAGNGDWSVASNWSRGVPDALKDAIANNNSADIIHIYNGNQAAHTLLMDDNLIITGGNLLLATGASTINGDLGLYGSTLTNDGILNLAGSTYLLNGQINGAGSSILTGGLIKFTNAEFNIDQAFTDNGAVDVANGALVLAQTSSLNQSVEVKSRGTLDLQSTTVVNNGVNFSGGGTVNNTGQLSLSNGAFNAVIVNQGVLNANQESFNASVENNGAMNLSGANSFSGGLQLDSGSITNGSTAASADLHNQSLDLSGSGVVRVNDLLLENLAATLIGADQKLVVVNGGISGQGVLSIAGETDLRNASLTNPVQLETGGILSVQTVLTDAGQVLNNAGTVDVLGGALNIGSGEQSGGFVVNSGATLNFDGNNSFNGNVNLSGGGNVVFHTGTYSGSGSITNSDTITVSGNTLFNLPVINNAFWVLASGTAAFASGFTQDSGQTIFSGGGFQGNYALNGGTIAGNGVITGDLNVGVSTVFTEQSPNQLTVTGSFNLNPDSIMNVVVGGATPGVSYDYLNVQGTVGLAGTLNVSINNNFKPVSGVTYTVMNFGSSTGSFSAINLPSSNLSYDVTTNAVNIQFESAANPVSSVGLGNSQTLIQASLQNPVIVANALIYSNSMFLESRRPIFFSHEFQSSAASQTCQ